jgi:hypothetical protein
MIVMSKPQRSRREDPDDLNDTAGSGKTVIRVKRGALRRFDHLTQKSAHLPVEVKWDRRTSERRGSAASTDHERRGEDRRQPPPFTWGAADFLVEGDRSGAEGPAENPRTKPRDEDGN